MLTSSNPSNQYLRPDYLSPLPATLDAKNSPLALLAQTCSAIGSDTPNPKLLANIEKSTKNHKLAECRDKSSPVSNQSSSSLSSSSVDTYSQQIQPQKSSFKPYESSNLRDKANLTPEDRSPSRHSLRNKTPKILSSQFQQQSQLTVASTTSTPSINGRCDSNQSATSQRDSPTTAIIVRKTPLTSSHHEQQEQQHQQLQEQNTSPHRASSKEPNGTLMAAPEDSPISRLSADTDENLVNPSKNLPTSLSMTSSTSASYFTGYPPGFSYSMDLMTASALMSPHHPMFKATASPYINYGRMKNTDATSLMTPICRDPYCAGCPLSPHVMSKAAGHPCPAGCTQCDHVTSKSYQSHSSAAAAAYAHAQLAALAVASQMPYVCSWIAGDAAYCGKRFLTSDELFQHLRTHTAALPDSVLGAGPGGILPTHPLFQRTYPTPPISPLSTARYHPYSKPSMLPPSLAPPSLIGLQMPPYPSLSQYFLPYSLYGSRIGTSPSMHP